MTRSFSIDDELHRQRQGPRLRAAGRREIYTITRCLPIESDGRVRYRIKSIHENFERIVLEEDLSPQD